MNSDPWGFDDRSAKPAAGGWDDEKDNPLRRKGPSLWHWQLTLIVLMVTTACVFIAHFLLRGNQNLSAPLVGLLFAVPVIAVLFTAFALEYGTSKMTPRFSRKGQALVALVASLAVFAAGCLGQLSFVSFTYQPSNYIFLVDKSDSMGYFAYTNGGSDSQNLRKSAFAELLDQLPDGTQVGFVLFSNVIIDRYPISPLDTQSRQRMLDVLNAYDDGGTDFSIAIDTALTMLRDDPALTASETNVVLITDGNSQTYLRTGEVEAACEQLGATISCVKLGYSSVDADLSQVIGDTGGRSVTAANIASLTQTLSTVSESDSSDILHNESSSAAWTAGLLFVFTGVALGLALMLMLSRSRQFRFQVILSPLAGAAAFAMVKLLDAQFENWAWIAAAFCLYGLIFMRMLTPAAPSVREPDSF